MFSVSVSQNFTAFHYLIGGDWGKENEHHSHDYRAEVVLEGIGLDRHGYLTDIVEIEKGLSSALSIFSGKTLNELPDFKGLNPSLEHFCRIVSARFISAIPRQGLSAVTVKLWENAQNWASFRHAFNF